MPPPIEPVPLIVTVGVPDVVVTIAEVPDVVISPPFIPVEPLTLKVAPPSTNASRAIVLVAVSRIATPESSTCISPVPCVVTVPPEASNVSPVHI